MLVAAGADRSLALSHIPYVGSAAGPRGVEQWDSIDGGAGLLASRTSAWTVVLERSQLTVTLQKDWPAGEAGGNMELVIQPPNGSQVSALVERKLAALQSMHAVFARTDDRPVQPVEPLLWTKWSSVHSSFPKTYTTFNALRQGGEGAAATLSLPGYVAWYATHPLTSAVGICVEFIHKLGDIELVGVVKPGNPFAAVSAASVVSNAFDVSDLS
jgi:hypothetical protein